MRFISALFFALAANPAAAAPAAFENLDSLDARVADILNIVDHSARAQPIDRRLRLRQCPQVPEVDAAIAGALTLSCPALGWRLRVPLIGGVAAPRDIVVRRGDTVEIVFSGTGFTVVTNATALDDGREGGVTRVKAVTGAAPVTARVIGPGRVTIAD